jgi:hypothetical protein
MQAFLAPDAKVWHNFDEVNQSVQETVAGMGIILGKISQVRYEERRCVGFEGGFVHQHAFTGIKADGSKLRIPACIVGTVEGGKVTRVDEYMDPIDLNALLNS